MEIMRNKSAYLQAVSDKKLASYMGLFFVVFVWGCGPLLTLELYKYYSPTFRMFFSEVVLVITYFIISRKHIKEFNWDYIKIGVPTGFFLALANISQKIGLMYTTPAKYAFLENLSCITVPILMFIFVKKKIGLTTVLSCILCLASVSVLNNVTSSDTSSWGIGEILCAIAGLLYGFNVAGTGAFAKKLFAPLYLAVQASVGIIISFIFSMILHFTTYTTSYGTQIQIEKIVFSFKPEHIIFAILVTVISSALCWTIRTNAMKYVDANAVAIIMPFSSVITGVLSVLTENDNLSINLVAGGTLGFLAIILSSFDDVFKKRK